MLTRIALSLLLLVGVYASAVAQTVKLTLSIENRGEIVIRLYPEKAPKTVAQIEKLVQSGFYNGLRFHRVDRKPRPFLVAVGDPRSKGDGPLEGLGDKGSGTKVPFEESGMEQDAGVVGLVRDVDDKNSGDSSFYILLAPARFLNGKYTAFGRIESGLDIAQKIEIGDRITSAKITRS